MRIYIFIILLLVALFYYKKESKFDKHIDENNKIFVSIASYRDPQLIHTVKSLYDNVSNPKLIRVVVCEQNKHDDEFYLDDKRVEIISLDYMEAKGPTHARYLIQQEWKNEEFYLQIDSHTRFVKNWDTKLKNELAMLPKLSCLSNYVSTFDINTGKIINSPLRGPMKVVEWDNDKICRYNSSYMKVNKVFKPMKSKGWSGCFSFSSSQIILDAPYDHNTPFLFFGEEMDIYMRLINRGWSMYVPYEPICFTLFDRSYRKTFWEHPDSKWRSKISKQRIVDRLYNNANHGRYSLK